MTQNHSKGMGIAMFLTLIGTSVNVAKTINCNTHGKSNGIALKKEMAQSACKLANQCNENRCLDGIKKSLKAQCEVEYKDNKIKIKICKREASAKIQQLKAFNK